MQATPKLGRAYPADSEFRGLHDKAVVVRRRRWSYRVTYQIRAAALVVLFFYPASYPVTHLDLVATSRDE